MKKGDLFPVYDRPAVKTKHPVMAQYIGEKRPPKKGEWYLSGAIVEAYLSPGLSTPYHIARLVKVEKTVTYKVIGPIE
jgi:hypothetical protein